MTHLENRSNLLIILFSTLILTFTFAFSKTNGFIAAGGISGDLITYSNNLMSTGNDADIGPLFGIIFLPILIYALFIKNMVLTNMIIYGFTWVFQVAIFIVMDLIDGPDIYATIRFDHNYALLEWLCFTTISFPCILFAYLLWDKKKLIQVSKKGKSLR